MQCAVGVRVGVDVGVLLAMQQCSPGYTAVFESFIKFGCNVKNYILNELIRYNSE